MIVELFHNYFGTKPVVYRSIQNALVALVVFVFAGIFCSSTAFASNAKNNNGVPVATQQCGAVPTDCSDIELCHRATFGGKEWRDAPVFKKFIKEAKSRNLECEKIFSYDLMSSIDKNGLSFGAFPPQPKLKSAPVFNLEAIMKGDRYANINYEKVKTYWTKELNNGPNFSGRYFLARYGCGTDCKWYRLIDLSNGEIFAFPIGGEEHWRHDLIFDQNSSLLKVIYPRHDYDKKLYSCVIKELSFYAETSKFVTENEYIFPVFQGDHCSVTADWKHVVKEFEKWKNSSQKPQVDYASNASSECNVANLSNCDQKQASKKPIVTSKKQSSGSANSLGKQIQIELKRVGCYLGAADGKIGPKSRSALFNFTNRAELEYDLSLFKNKNFLSLLKDYPAGTCRGTSKKASTTSTAKKSTSTQSSSSNTAEIQALQREREQLNQSLLAIQNSMAQQERAANAGYRACLSGCLLNNKAGGGFSNAFSGMAQCNNSCAPLKYGGAVVPPSWERGIKRMKTIDCTITQLSRNQATARCNEF